MKLIRLAYMRFSMPSERCEKWTMGVDGTDITVLSIVKTEKGECVVLVKADASLPDLPNQDCDGLLVVDQVIRKRLEQAIEHAANIVAVANFTRRKITSPSPCAYLVPENEQEQTFLAQSAGMQVKRMMVYSPDIALELQQAPSLFGDRLDGVAILAEALAQQHATGRFHECFRLFERAFAKPPDGLISPLSKFLSNTRFGYTKAEVKPWIWKYRHGATHADRDGSFIKECDLGTVIQRVYQAAFDVLANKRDWRSPSTDRRQGWAPITGTASIELQPFFTIHDKIPVRISPLDEFAVFPREMKLKMSSIPVEWWFRDAQPRQIAQAQAIIWRDVGLMTNSPRLSKAEGDVKPSVI